MGGWKLDFSLFAGSHKLYYLIVYSAASAPESPVAALGRCALASVEGYSHMAVTISFRFTSQ
jgi:hypothetical protein